MSKKNNIIFLMACLSAFACSKIENDNQPARPVGEEFVAGEEVTLFASAGEKDKSKVSSEDKDGKIDFVWEEGDTILVTVDEKSSKFALAEGAGSTRGRFVGTMPAAGNNFDVQYPVKDPDLSTQDYSYPQALPHGKMKFTGVGTLDTKRTSTLSLKPAYSALQMNLYGPGLKIDSVKITIGAEKYVLNCGGDGKVLPSSGNDHFYIVLPAATNVNVTATVFSERTDGSNLPEYSSYGKGTMITPGGKTELSFKIENTSFEENKVKNTPEIRLGTVWAPVNCGYANTNAAKYGLYYQFGRYHGVTRNPTTIVYTDVANRRNPASDTYYCNKGGASNYPDWFTGTMANQFGNWPMKNGDKEYNYHKIDNPCPSGWRVPKIAELESLLGSCSGKAMQTGTHGLTENLYGRYFNGTSESMPTSGVFLPAASYITYTVKNDKPEITSTNPVGEALDYWASEVTDKGSKDWNTGQYLNMKKDAKDPAMTSTSRLLYGFSVRCVQE